MSTDVRALLAEADQARRTAEAVEMIGVSFRLGDKLAVKPGRFGWRSRFRRESEPEFRALNADESLALYRAAQIVRRECLKRAKELEARVTTTPADELRDTEETA